MRKTPLRPGSSRLRSRSFTELHGDDEDPRYGVIFKAMRRMECALAVLGYRGPGHEGCGPGQQRATPTACHLSKKDPTLMLPGCGRAHDLYDGRGGRTAAAHFRAWLKSTGKTLHEWARVWLERVRHSPTDLDY